MEAENVTGEICTLLGFLREIEKSITHFDFPYYWDLDPNIYKSICYNIYWPKVTHELCERDLGGGRRDRKGFTVISTKDTHRAESIGGIEQSVVLLPDGVYRLKSVQYMAGERKFKETWEEVSIESTLNPRHLPTIFTRTINERLSSLPGIGSRYFEHDVGAGVIAKMQITVELTNKRIKEISEAYPDANSVLLLGYSGVGKSVLVNLLVGGGNNLQTQRIDGVMRLVAAQEHARVGHGRCRGTGEPSGFLWKDFDPGINNVALWDTVGLGDPSSSQDIITAYNLRHLFQSISAGNVKIVMVADEDSMINRGNEGGFLKLLNDIAEVFPNVDQLRQVISSLVVTKHNGSVVSDVLTGILREQEEEDGFVLAGNARAVPNLSASARELVRYIIGQAGTRIIPFPNIAIASRAGDPYPQGTQVRNAVL